MSFIMNILIVDDDEAIRDSCTQLLTEMKVKVDNASDGSSGLKKIKQKVYDIVILDLKMPGLSGMKLLKKIKEINPETLVVVITGYATVDSAVDAMKNGAYDFLPKPFTPEELRLIIKRALEKRKLVLDNLHLRQELETSLGSENLIGDSKAMKRVKKLIQKVGPTGSTVLITGESGTGKELVARAIHKNSQRNQMPFVTVDCSTLVENLFESELFGHVKGSFTGATVTKHGRLELANHGTVFFDEISNIGMEVQAKLLRAIQEREIIKVGSSQAIKIDIRIIAATNKDLRKAVQENSFREDLFYRLSVVPLFLPPLRERKDDVSQLVEYFINKYNVKRNKSIQGISEQTLKALTEYNWPGNVRELENVIERAVVLTENDYIKPNDLSYYGLGIQEDTKRDYSLDEVEKQYINRTLNRYNGHKKRTAEVLGIDRKTLRLKIRKYGLE
ncbi:MAG: sigma-54 dependent transcriptional regulator [bacterium]